MLQIDAQPNSDPHKPYISHINGPVNLFNFYNYIYDNLSGIVLPNTQVS